MNKRRYNELQVAMMLRDHGVWWLIR